jgi:hypothetical protein
MRLTQIGKLPDDRLIVKADIMIPKVK